jgi:hypothetical protein
MFIDQLRLTITAQQHAKIIKPGNHTLQLYAVNQEDCDGDFGLANVV